MDNPIAYLQIETNTGTIKFEITPDKTGYEITTTYPEKLDIAHADSFSDSLNEITNYLFLYEIEILN